jgi:hypothetical protein
MYMMENAESVVRVKGKIICGLVARLKSATTGGMRGVWVLRPIAKQH